MVNVQTRDNVAARATNVNPKFFPAKTQQPLQIDLLVCMLSKRLDFSTGVTCEAKSGLADG